MMEAPGFFVEDLFDLSNDDEIIGDNFLFTHSSTGSSLTAPNSCISTDSNILPDFPNSCFAQGLPVPYDDLREIDWLSNLVDGSFALNDFGMTTGPVTRSEPDSRRNLQARIPTPKEARRKKKLSRRGPMIANAGPGPGRKARRRRCLHCAAERTPQWRAGPKGPKTLCNACGVRFNSGRLVPEYRPAASPSFVPTKHSNSHRKVLEMRRQKEGGKSRPRRTRVYFGRNPPRSGVF